MFDCVINGPRDLPAQVAAIVRRFSATDIFAGTEDLTLLGIDLQWQSYLCRSERANPAPLQSDGQRLYRIPAVQAIQTTDEMVSLRYTSASDSSMGARTCESSTRLDNDNEALLLTSSRGGDVDFREHIDASANAQSDSLDQFLHFPADASGALTVNVATTGVQSSVSPMWASYSQLVQQTTSTPSFFELNDQTYIPANVSSSSISLWVPDHQRVSSGSSSRVEIDVVSLTP